MQSMPRISSVSASVPAGGPSSSAAAASSSFSSLGCRHAEATGATALRGRRLEDGTKQHAFCAQADSRSRQQRRRVPVRPSSASERGVETGFGVSGRATGKRPEASDSGGKTGRRIVRVERGAPGQGKEQLTLERQTEGLWSGDQESDAARTEGVCAGRRVVGGGQPSVPLLRAAFQPQAESPSSSSSSPFVFDRQAAWQPSSSSVLASDPSQHASAHPCGSRSRAQAAPSSGAQLEESEQQPPQPPPAEGSSSSHATAGPQHGAPHASASS